MSASADKRRTGPARSVAFGRTPLIQTPKLGARFMRYELADYEWVAIKPMLPNIAHQPRVADNVSGEDRGKFAGLAHSSGTPALRIAT
jgi:hypothetical protein